jgi:hypothetical protein
VRTRRNDRNIKKRELKNTEAGRKQKVEKECKIEYLMQIEEYQRIVRSQ